MKSTEEMRYLGWKQPFASLMLHGKAETRTWDTKYRGLVLITASKIPYSDNMVKQISGTKQFERMAHKLGCETMPKGQAIAVGRLVDCKPMRLCDEDICFVAYQPGLFVHVYENVRPIVPIPFKGAQGWRKLTSEFISQIKYL